MKRDSEMSDLYDTDVVSWSERQAALLRRMAAGERVNDQVDWPNVIEEVESVGQSQVDSVGSLLFQVFLHDLKAEAWPLARDAPSRRGDARGFRAQARRKYRPSMRQKIDVAASMPMRWRRCPTRWTDRRQCRCKRLARCSRSMRC